MGLRYEAWSPPWDPGGFFRKVAMLPAIDGSGSGSVGFLAFPGDSSVDLSLAGFDRLDDLISDTQSSLITVYDCQPDGTNTIIDEWILNRLPSRLVEEKKVSLSGPGLLASFEKALVYAFDFPKSPAIQADWIWGAGEDTDSTGLIQNGDFEASPFPNGGFEDGNDGYWLPTVDDDGLFATSVIQAIFSPVDARTGDWYGTVIVNAQGDGIRRTFSGLIPGEQYTITGWINEPSGAGDRIRAGIIGATSASHTNAYEEEEIWWAEIGNAAEGAGATTGVYQQVTLTFIADEDSAELVIIYDDVNTLDFNIDDFSFTSGDNVGLDPWYSIRTAGLHAASQAVVNVFRHDTTQSHSGAGSVRWQGVDDANYSAFGTKGYGAVGFGQAVRMVPGRLYTFTAWVRHNGAGANGATERLRLVLARKTPKGPLAETITGEFRPAPGSYYMAHKDELVTQNTWTKIQMTVVADVSEISAEFRYAGTNARNQDVGSFNSPTIWVDDISIHEGLPATSIGDIWQRLLNHCSLHHASNRGTVLDWVDYSSFSATLDSNGNPWNVDVTFLARWGSNMAHVLDDTFNLGYEAELVRKATPSGGKTHDFHLYNPGGRDDTPATAIHTGQPITGGDSVRRNPAATAVLVAGPDGAFSQASDATALANFGRLETFISDNEATGAISRQLLSDNFFAFESGNRNAVRFETIEADGVPRPFVDYRPGDTIPMTMAPSLPREERRVQRIDYLNSHPTQYVVVGSRLLEGEAAAFDLIGRMWRRMSRPAKIEGRASIGGGNGEGKGAPSIVIAASDSSDISKSKADFICDGTNDYQVIQEAINMLDGPGGRGRVLLCEGEFYCTESINVLPGIHLTGVSRTHTFLYADDNATPLLTVGNGCTISDLYIDGGVFDGTLMEVHGGYTQLRDLVVEGGSNPAAIGIKKISTGRLLIKGVIFDGTEGPAITADPGDGDYITIDGCYFSQGDGAVVVIPGTFNEEFIFVNNQIFSPISGVHLEGIIHGIVANNIWLSSNDEILTLDANCENVIVNGNVIYQTNESGGIECAGTKCVITNNFIHGSGFAAHPGILITGDNNVVSDNLIFEPDSHGIVITADLCVVTGNLIDQPGVTDDGLYDGIIVTGDDNMIHGNRIRPSLYVFADTRYGINIVSGNDNIVYANSLGDVAEYGTADFIDNGTGTITHPGANGQFNAGGSSLAAAPGIISFSQAGTLSVGSGTFQFPFPFDATLVSVIAAVATAPAGDDIVLDVNLNGTSIYPTATKPTIVDATEVSALAPPDTTAVTAGDLLTVDIDQVGSGTPGSDLTVAIHYQ